jgi:hypothetical protein
MVAGVFVINSKPSPRMHWCIAASDTLLGWEFRFFVPISGTPIISRIPIPFLIPKIPVGFFFQIPLLKNQEIGIPIPKF